MKRAGFLYEKICSRDNIVESLRNASKGKGKKQAIIRVMKNTKQAYDDIEHLLKTKTYIPSKYFEATIYDGLNKKERTIYKPKFFPDQVIHWCLISIIKPLIMRGMYRWSCASLPKRGTLYAKNACEKWIRNNQKETKYCLKIDIKKFYPSINKEKLKQKFRKIIKDSDTLWLIDSIIDSHNEGLPIGNYTSQWFANFFLQDTDHFIKNNLKIKFYIRYMDDMILFHSNKRKLREIRGQLIKKLEEESLKIKGNWQIFNVSKRRLDFCGYCFEREKTFVRKRITNRMRKRSAIFKKSQQKHTALSLMSYLGWLKHSDSYILYKKYYASKIKQMKRCIKNAD